MVFSIKDKKSKCAVHITIDVNCAFFHHKKADIEKPPLPTLEGGFAIITHYELRITH